MTSTVTATVLSQTWKRDAGSVTGLDLGIGTKQLLTGATFTISGGDRVALLGRNGCGKSTLFGWIRDAATAAGAWSVYEVAQELAPSGQSVLAVVLGAHLERGAMWARLGELEADDYEMTGADLEEHGRLHEELQAAGADGDESRAAKILHGLGFSMADMRRPLTEFSGGWRARVALAQGLFMEPDLLLLDEPTNHLDLDGVMWLTEYLAEWTGAGAVVVISHNRGFVRGAANSIWEIGAGRLRTYKCRYDRYLKQKGLDEKAAAKAWVALEKEVNALKCKGTPQARKAAADLLAKRAREGVVRPEPAYRPRFFFDEFADGEGGDGSNEERRLISTDEADLGYDGAVVLVGVTFGLYGGSRVALVGANGSGKSTLLRFLNGEIPAVEGHVERRPGLQICKFDQHFYHLLPADKTAIEFVGSLCGGDSPMVRKLLGASGLKGPEQEQAIGTLSGGQKARVYFASLAAQGPDVLLMDEPTNHLDIETIDGLAAGLADFPGAVVVVSHDLDFLETVTEEVWLTADGRLQRLESLDAYLELAQR